jgi:2-oxoglutarate/2-oxoacid ferredoxin oxidoreductase subunit alpha
MSNKQVRLMQGNEACVEGALAAGMKFYGGYPITPSTEIAEFSAQRLPLVGGKFIQMEDEIAGLAVVIGAALTGVKAMTATSGPGFSLKQENIGYACIAEIPCVIVNVQRSGPSTGLPTAPAQGDIMQAKWGTHGDRPVIALSPSSVKETFDLTVKCFNLAEKYRTPVFLMLDEVIGHMREKIEIPDASEIEIINRKLPSGPKEEYVPYKYESDCSVPEMAPFGEGYRYHVTGLVHDESGFPSNKSEDADKLIRRINNKVTANADDIIMYEEIDTEDADVLIVAYGCTARSAQRTLKMAREQGLKVGLFRPISIWPFPESQMAKLAQRVSRIIVPELNLGQLVIEVDRICSKFTKVESLNKVNGEIITPSEILAKIKEGV